MADQGEYGGRGGGDRRHAATTTVITLPEGVGPGAIIGRGGERIRELRRATGASVVVNATHRTVEVKGSSEHGAATPSPPSFALVRDAHDARSAFLSARPDQAQPAPNTTTEVFSLPEGVGPGAIIGRGGDRICELRRSTGARVLVNASDRTVEVRGTVEQVRAAEAALSALVHQARQSRVVAVPTKRLALLATEFDEGLRFVAVTDDANGVDLRWYSIAPPLADGRVPRRGGRQQRRQRRWASHDGDAPARAPSARGPRPKGRLGSWPPRRPRTRRMGRGVWRRRSAKPTSPPSMSTMQTWICSCRRLWTLPRIRRGALPTFTAA
eukprot:TRINITY_DN852_c0_g1_i12.p2 TRINITY_DN852_c0_g1~~TRINITY_DN852_c0_g1_i12.p2  ORF type:complete len:374 (-),score=76.85 TRINITY_DN852_c0_g1_i12:135-1112(-)